MRELRIAERQRVERLEVGHVDLGRHPARGERVHDLVALLVWQARQVIVVVAVVPELLEASLQDDAAHVGYVGPMSAVVVHQDARLETQFLGLKHELRS
jgi:hypothetical protein